MARRDDTANINPRSNVLDAVKDFFTVESRLDHGGAIMRDRSYPIEEGANIGYEEWIRRYAGHIATRELAPAHKRAWEWAESLKKGKMPPAYLACWPRGTGKSTTVELIIARMSHTVNRNFVLYVSAKQESADNHVADIASLMEQIGIERAVTQYGYSKGWTASRLRTANGFNVLAFGLDAHTRGVKLDNLRPGVVVFDDIDQESDSAAVTQSKIDAITKAVIPAGSPDVAIFFAQNAIHAGSIMSQLLNKELSMLRNRLEDVVPAVHGLRTEEVEIGGREVIRITGGDSAWPGIGLPQWEDLLNATGLQAFRVEYQHEVGAGGLFFRFLADKDGKPWHVVDPFEIPKHFHVFAGHDYGTTAAACSYLAAVDEHGDVYVFGEEYKAGRESAEQAQAFKDMCRLYDVDPSQIIIAFDWANTFPPKDVTQKLGEYPVEKWWAMNLNAIMAVKDRVAGWANIRSWLRETRLAEDGSYVPRLKIMRGRAPYLQSFLERAMSDPKHPEDVSVAESLTHAGDAFRYCLMQRPMAVTGTVQSAKEIRNQNGQTVSLPAHMDSYIRRQMESILTGKPAHEYNKPYTQARG